MSISNPTVNPQNSDRVKPVVNTTNFPGLILDINAKNIADLVIGEKLTSFTDGVGNILTASIPASSGIYGVAGTKGTAIYFDLSTTETLDLSTPLALTTKPTVLISSGLLSSGTVSIGVGDTGGFAKGIGQGLNNSPYVTRDFATLDYKETFNFLGSLSVVKVTAPLHGGMVTHIAENASGDWSECYADYKSGVAEHEVANHTGAGATGAHASNDWSTETLGNIVLPPAATSYVYAMRLIELDTALTDVELEQLALFVARNPYDLPEFLVDH